ncbi:MAG: hypothetical protein II948_09005 [Synergistaceae bacterium]|nr:hypothetical protein [Synergistaceae bacterium]
MKKIIFVMLFVMTLGVAADAKLPATYKEFKARYQNEAKTPQGAVKLYFEGVFAFINPETRAEGGKMLRYAMYADRPIERSTYYATFVERMKDPDYNYAFRSYAEGATPENNYSMNPDNFKIRFADKGKKDPGGYLRLGLRSSGADSPRVVWVKKYDDGLWYVINNAATYVQVKEPKSEQIRRSHAHDADYDEPEPEVNNEPEPKVNEINNNEPKPKPEVNNSDNSEPEPEAEWD